MEPKDEKTLYAAMRLIKSRMRKYVWEHKGDPPTYETMVSLEETIERTAKGEWDAALAEWDRSDPEQRLRVEALVGEAFFRSTKDLLECFGEIAPLLSEYVSTHRACEILEDSHAAG